MGREKIDQRRELSSGQQRKQARQEVVREEQKKVASRLRRESKRPPPCPRKASAWNASARCRCSIRRNRPSCRRCRCSMSREQEPVYSEEALEAMSRLVELKLRDFGVEAEVVAVQPGR